MGQGVRSLPNKAIKVLSGLWPSTGRPCQGAAYGWRYGGGCRTVSHWVLSVLEKTMERRKYNGLSYDFGIEAGL